MTETKSTNNLLFKVYGHILFLRKTCETDFFCPLNEKTKDQQMIFLVS